jgi:predicted small lipoprotein YifL
VGEGFFDRSNLAEAAEDKRQSAHLGDNGMRLPNLLTGTAVVFLILTTLCGCGKRGALIAPEALVPAPISNLAVLQQGDHFQISWSAPTKEQGGAHLKDLAGFILFRRVLLPANQDCEECAGAYAERARIDLQYLQDTRLVGNLYLFDDRDLKKELTYQYKVRSLSADGAQSRDSNKAHRTAFTAPFPPVLEANSSATGVVLSFVAIPPEEGKLAGYNIFRSKSGQPMPLAPLNPKPLNLNTYEDKEVQIGLQYDYTVRAVVAFPNGETADSAPSNEASGTLLERD